MITTLYSQVITISAGEPDISTIKITANCLSLIKASKLGRVFIGIGNSNEAAGDSKCTLFYYVPDTNRLL